jgi:hypothetical protein
VENGKLLVVGTEPGPGRIDAFGAARNLLFPKDAGKMQSPVSFPFIWDVPDTVQQSEANAVWIHYDGNTNSILERNIGQALGMGAVFDPTNYKSTLRIENLHWLEVQTHKLSPPKWPVDVLGSIDETKAKAGEKIFNTMCRDCHQNRLFDLTDVGTDPQRANSFGQPVASAGGKPFPLAVKPILDSLKARAFLDDGVSADDQKKMDAPNVIWRATGQYLARPLTGAWATAPYLHNGSVPTLWHLLHSDQLLVAAGEGATLAGQQGPRRQWLVAVERLPKEPLKVSKRFCLTPSLTWEIMRTPSTICAAARAVAQLP